MLTGDFTRLTQVILNVIGSFYHFGAKDIQVYMEYEDKLDYLSIQIADKKMILSDNILEPLNHLFSPNSQMLNMQLFDS